MDVPATMVESILRSEMLVVKNELIKIFSTAKVETIINCGHISWKNNLKEFETILNRFYQADKA